MNKLVWSKACSVAAEYGEMAGRRPASHHDRRRPSGTLVARIRGPHDQENIMFTLDPQGTAPGGGAQIDKAPPGFHVGQFGPNLG
jgi:hypothetical protein